MITSVWSAYGHRFISEDDSDSCLTCGALYQLIPTPDAPNEGRYCTASGDDPADCTHDTGMVHGYPGERYCHECDSNDCKHCDHDCPCIACDS